MIVRFVGPQGVPLAGRFIYPGETREVNAEQLRIAAQAHPGWFEVDGAQVFPPEAHGDDDPEGDGVSLPSPIEPVLEHGDDVIVGDEVIEVADVSSVEHVDQPAAKRRGGSKQRTK